MIEDRRVCSLNKAAYLKSRNYAYEIKWDSEREDLFYLVFDGDIGEAIKTFYADEVLQAYNDAYKELKEEIFELKRKM